MMFDKTVKNFAIVFHSGNGQSTFKSGDLITGQLSFELTKEVKISHITMEVVGKADVHWSRPGGKKRSRRHYSAQLEFFRLRSTIMEDNGGRLSAACASPLTVWGEPFHPVCFLSQLSPDQQNSLPVPTCSPSRVSFRKGGCVLR